MKKIIILIIILNFSVNAVYSACSLTGGACSINDLNNKQTVQTDKKDNAKEKTKQDKSKQRLKFSTKNYGQNNIDRNSK